MSRNLLLALPFISFAALALPLVGQRQFDLLEKRHLPRPTPDINRAMVCGDIDGDGDLDLVLGHVDNFQTGPAQNQLYVNDGTGRYLDATIQQLPPIADSTLAMALGDADGDGDLDLMVGNSGLNRLYQNDGNGAFTETTGRLPTVSNRATYAVAFVDVDGDGDNDLVLGNSRQNELYLNNGRGFFDDVTVRLPIDNDFTRALAFGDVDGDGDNDLVLANTDNSGKQNRLYVNDGSGRFTDATVSGMPAATDRTHAVALGDVDNDGDPDIVFGNSNAPSGAQNTLYRNDGRGIFMDATAASLPQVEDATESLALRDADLDGDLDLLLANASQDRYYVNDGAGSFADVTAARMPIESVWNRALVVADVDGDGDDDFVTWSRLYLNLSGGVLAKTSVPRLAADLFADSPAIAIGDVDGDGDPDLVVAHTNFSWGVGWPNGLHLNDGRGFFEDLSAARMPISGDGSFDVALNDVDGDNDLDIVLANGNSGYLTHSNRLLLNDGRGFFVDSGSWPPDFDRSSSLALADVDGDGDDDVVFGNSDSRNRLYLNEGGGRFSKASNQRLPATVALTSDVAFGDIDGDGDPDLVTGNTGYYAGFGDQNRLFRNDGAGFFIDVTASQMPSDSDSTSDVEFVDVDADGDQDLVLANTGESQLYLNDGAGYFTPSPAFATLQISSMAMSVGDLDGDGDPDILFAEAGVYLNDGTGTFVAALMRALAPALVQSVATADLDADGDLDLVYGAARGNEVQVNLLRQLDSPVVVGSGYQLDAYARYGPARTADLVFPLVSTAPATIPLPPFGTLGVDPSVALALPRQVVSPTTGVVSWSFAVPNIPGLAGVRLYAQALLWQQPVSAHLTNVTFDRIRR